MGGYIRGPGMARKPAEPVSGSKAAVRFAAIGRGSGVIRIASKPAAVVLVVVVMTGVGPAGAADAWQHAAQTPDQIGRSFTLGVRNPAGRGAYRAIFVVRTPDGQTLRRVVRIYGNGWGQLRYPQSFGAPYLPGRYAFRVVVRGRTVIRASFRLR